MMTLSRFKAMAGIGYYLIKHWANFAIEGIKEVPAEQRYNNARKFVEDVLNFAKVNVNASGLENLVSPPGIIVSNHLSYADGPAIFSILAKDDKKVYFASKKSLFKVPFYGRWIRELGMMEVDYSNIRSTLKSMEICVERAIREKAFILIYPEGMINSTEDVLLPFKKGAFHAAVKSGLPVIPTACCGGEKIVKKNFEIEPGDIYVKFLPAIYPDKNCAERVEMNRIRQKSERAMLQAIRELRER